tara:strand:- start:6215 stop:6937 length:723 start_codon:yes stop_codon:yes gene_type:complete
MDWFSDWFNSKYYHILYQNRDEKEAEQFLSKLQVFFRKTNQILDIACGSGRHSIFLNSLGYQITGIDLSVKSIKAAKQRSDNKILFDVWDMRKTYKKEHFDVVLNLFTSFGYFDSEKEDFSAIQAISSNLKYNGILIIDFLNSEKVIANLVESEQNTLSGITFNINRKLEEGFILKNIKFTDKGNDFEFTEKVKAFNLSDFTKLLNFAQLKIINIFGDYKLNKYIPTDSDRLIIVAKKWK